MWDTKENWMGQQGLHPGANPPPGFRWSEYQRGQEAARQARETEDRRRNAAWTTPMNHEPMAWPSRPASGSGGAEGPRVIDPLPDWQNWLIVIGLFLLLALPVIFDVLAFLNR